MIGFIYILKCPKSNEVIYVGATTQPLSQRLSNHMSDAKKCDYRLYEYINEAEIVPMIELVAKYEFNEMSELFNIEAEWIEKFRQSGCPIKNVLRNKSVKRVKLNKIKNPAEFVINTRSTKSVKLALSEMAERENKTVSEVIRIALTEFVIQENSIQAKKK
jgi:Uri superfamily endonuclease